MRHKARGSQEKLRHKACEAAEDAKPDARGTREHVEKKTKQVRHNSRQDTNHSGCDGTWITMHVGHNST